MTSLQKKKIALHFVLHYTCIMYTIFKFCSTVYSLFMSNGGKISFNLLKAIIEIFSAKGEWIFFFNMIQSCYRNLMMKL